MQDELTSCGGIKALVQILAAGSPRLKLCAANALKNCAAASSAGREAVESSGAISLLVKQLGYPKWYTPGTRRYVQVLSSARSQNIMSSTAEALDLCEND